MQELSGYSPVPYLLPGNRCVKHIKNVVVRGISAISDSNGYNLYYTLHQEKTTVNDDENKENEPVISKRKNYEEEPFYKSEVIYSTLNPLWKDVDFEHGTSLELQKSHCFLLCLWNIPDNEESGILLFKREIDLRDHVHLSLPLEPIMGNNNERSQVITGLKHNAHLIQLCDGYYVVKKTADDLKNNNLLPDLPRPPRDREQFSVSANIECAEKLKNNTEAITRKRADKEKYLQNLKESIKKHTTITLEQAKLHNLQNQVNSLNEKKQFFEQLYEEQKMKMTEKEKENSERLDALVNLLNRIDNWTQDLDHEVADMKEDQKECNKLSGLIDARRLKLLSLLYSIYPIKWDEAEHIYKIRGIPLSDELLANTSNANEIILNSALGYVTHLTILLGKYLQVPFRYPMKYYPSQSVITDLVSASPICYPLFINNNKIKMDTGLNLLRKNISTIITSQQLDIDINKGILPSLYELFAYFLFL
ncbi:hypothetical protein WA158_008000 [Blastocystis sp. Blastoise]